MGMEKWWILMLRVLCKMLEVVTFDNNVEDEMIGGDVDLMRKCGVKNEMVRKLKVMKKRGRVKKRVL